MSSYTDLARAKLELSLSDAVDADDDDITLLGEIDEEMSRLFELKTGRIWGGTATPAAKTVDGPAAGYSDILMLPVPVRSVTTVAITGDSPETLASDDWVLWQQTREGDYHAIKRIDGGWFPRRNGKDRVTVTGVWSDTASGATVPAEIAAACTFVVVETFRQKKSSPSGEVGPDGMTIRPRNPWNFEQVKESIAKYKAAKPRVSF